MVNVNTLDFNLLKTFDAIYRYRNVSLAAAQIGLAQSSMSNALSRLRNQFDDPLFQRSPGGVVPTEKADELAPQIATILNNISDMLAPKVFDPATAQAELVIAASDFVVTTLAPSLVAALREQAPNITLNFVALDKPNAFERLDSNDYQIAVGTFSDMPARFFRKSIQSEQFICIASSKNKQVEGGLSLDSYANTPHVLMTLKGDRVGVIDTELKKRGYTRQVAMTCSQFLPLIEVVAGSDLIATIPSSLQSIAQRAGCNSYPLPFSMPSWQSEWVVTQKFYTSSMGKFILKFINQVSADLSI